MFLNFLSAAIFSASLSTDDGVRCYAAKFSRAQAQEQGHNLSYALLFIEDIRKISSDAYNPEGDFAVRFRDRPELWGAGFSCQDKKCTSFIDEDSGFDVVRIEDTWIELDMNRFGVFLDVDRQRDVDIKGKKNLTLLSVDLQQCQELPLFITYLES